MPRLPPRIQGREADDPIRWVFLDVGGVILDEDVLTYHVFLRHAQAIRRVRPDATVPGLIAEREARARDGSRWPLFDLTSTYLDAARVAATWDDVDREVRARYGDFLPPIAGATEALSALSARFRLGLIANQPSSIREVLRALDLLGRFEVVCLSEEVGTAKPDPGLFLKALHMAGTGAAEAVMVGDRIRQDVIPAGDLGMRTVQIDRGDAREWANGDRDPDFCAYRASLRHIEAEERRASRRSATFEVASLADAASILIGSPVPGREGPQPS